MILGGDIGGTKCNLGAFEERGGKLVCLKQQRYPSRDFPRFEDVVSAFLREIGTKPAAACFGVAGPVIDNRVKATNLPWVIDGPSFAKEMGIPRVTLLNDMQATVYSIRILEPEEFFTLSPGEPEPEHNQALIAAGTGLGEAMMYWDGRQHLVIATEGGHASFAARTDVEIEFLRWMKSKYEWVSNELILSGKGFREIHEFLDPGVKHPGFDDPRLDAAAPEITRRALEGTCPVCSRALDLWLDIYGAEAGNLALRAIARGGVFVAGGISVKILSRLKQGRFVEAFAQKPKFTDFLKQIPIRVLLNEAAPLFGAAYVAWKAI